MESSSMTRSAGSVRPTVTAGLLSAKTWPAQRPARPFSLAPPPALATGAAPGRDGLLPDPPRARGDNLRTAPPAPRTPEGPLRPTPRPPPPAQAPEPGYHAAPTAPTR